MVGCVKGGKMFLLNLGKLDNKNFQTDFTSADFPTDLIFKREKWMQKENYESILKDGENVDLSGNEGQYIMGDGFTVGVMWETKGMDLDAKMGSLKALIPHHAEFSSVIINP